MFPLDLVPKAYLAENGDQFIELYKMASGFGFNGHEGRCYRFWKEVEECNVRLLLFTTVCLQPHIYITRKILIIWGNVLYKRKITSNVCIIKKR